MIGTKSTIEINYNKFIIIKKVNNKKSSVLELNNEIKILKYLASTKFVNYSELLDHKKSEYITIKLLEGQSLSTLLSNSNYFVKSSLLKKSFIISQLFNRFFKVNIVHNDLACSNIIFNENKEIAYIIDYGRAIIGKEHYVDLAYFWSDMIKIRCVDKGVFYNFFLTRKRTQYVIMIFKNIDLIKNDKYSKRKIIRFFFFNEKKIFLTRDFRLRIRFFIILSSFYSIIIFIIAFWRKENE